MEKPRDTAGILPFYINKEGKIVYAVTTEINRLIDRQYIKEQAGTEAAELVPEDYIMYMPAKGKVELGETHYQTALREAAEEMGYNSTGIPLATRKGAPVEPNGTAIKSFGEYQKKIKHGLRGEYRVYLYVEQIEEGSFKPKPPLQKTETSIEKRKGNHFLGDGGDLVTLEEIKASLEPVRKLLNHPDVQANLKLHEYLQSSLKSREEQLEMIEEIETNLKQAFAIDLFREKVRANAKNSP